MKKKAVAAPPPPVEVSSTDRTLLTGAYQAGLIAGWLCDRERGFRLTLADRRDEYVEPAKLTSYLAGLRKLAS